MKLIAVIQVQKVYWGSDKKPSPYQEIHIVDAKNEDSARRKLQKHYDSKTIKYNMKYDHKVLSINQEIK